MSALPIATGLPQELGPQGQPKEGSYLAAPQGEKQLLYADGIDGIDGDGATATSGTSGSAAATRDPGSTGTPATAWATPTIG